MSGIGGFPGLDAEALGPEPCPGGVGFSTARAALGALLDLTRPSRVWLPAWTCPVTLAPIERRGIAVSRFTIGPDLAPRLPAVGAGELVVVVNYLGLLDPVVDALADQLGASLLVDDAQAFHHRPRGGAWAINSARKFFGVPDGAWLFGPELPAPPARRFDPRGAPHLEARARGASDALALFRVHEARLGEEGLGVSLLGVSLLGRVDLARDARERRRNWARLHALLGERNALSSVLSEGAAPLAYPYLPRRAVDLGRLRAAGLFIPRYWPGLGLDGAALAWERRLARALLPLPVDGRYAEPDMQRVAETLTQTEDR